ncbi:histidine phosphatase family protein [Corynebacterium fournieri]|uniref:histidine phosphatase family protein n=1 Tax=Corynebacterium fournieri TaxID=1852390 RepID=UPI000A2EFB97|nr:histidine phosphatase family protein [Corynebacterium fournieri]WJY98118.1 Glucosyl-3-phosphoglycerate phosphatase [Corynebacterium fournieri]
MQRRLILLRHGETEYNATSRMQGQLDTVLSQRGVDQAHAAAKELLDLGISKIVSSDLMRAKNTAEVVAADLGLPVGVDERLRETHLGEWQGKTHNEVDSAHEGARAVWRTDASWAPPRGESRLQVAERSRAVVDELMRDYDEWDNSAVLLVSHGGTIAALTASLLGFVVAQYPAIKGLGNANTARLVAMPRLDEPTETRWFLEAWNRGLN